MFDLTAAWRICGQGRAAKTDQVASPKRHSASHGSISIDDVHDLSVSLVLLGGPHALGATLLIQATGRTTLPQRRHGRRSC